MKRSSLFGVGMALLLAALSWALPASAQSLAILPSGCGTGSFVNGVPYLTVDSTGRLCDSISGTITPAPTAGQGCTPYHLSGGTTASNNSTSVKAAVGTVCRWTLINTNASTIGYLKVYDSAAAPTCSSATGLKHVYPILAGPGGVQTIDAMGEAYVSGIGFCVTGGGGDTDNSNAATGIYIEGSYK